VLLGFQQQISPRFLAQEPQDIELLVVVFGASPDYNISDSLRASIRSLLLPSFPFFRVLHTSTSLTWGFSRSYNQAAQVPSSNVTRISPRSPSMNCKMVLALVSMTHSITTLPTEFLTATEILSVCTSMPIYLALVTKNCMNFLKKIFLSGDSDPKEPPVMKTISYRGGVVTFRIPESWNEEYSDTDGGTFYEDKPDSGTLRLKLITAESPSEIRVIPQHRC
jgi:hypothetical protein